LSNIILGKKLPEKFLKSTQGSEDLYCDARVNKISASKVQ
jgi:hypothetical protein